MLLYEAKRVFREDLKELPRSNTRDRNRELVLGSWFRVREGNEPEIPLVVMII